MSRRTLAAVAALGLPGWGWALWQATRPAAPTVYVERLTVTVERHQQVQPTLAALLPGLPGLGVKR